MKKLLCVILTLALVLATAAGCSRQYDPQVRAGASGSGDDQSEPESSQADPEPSTPKPIMPVPSSPEDDSEPEEDPEPEPEPEDDPEPEEDEEPDDDQDGEDADEDSEDEDDEDGEEEDEEEEEGCNPPEVPYGSELSWLDLSTVTVGELRPVVDQMLARADYFCKFGLSRKFTEAGPDPRPEVGIKRKFRTNDVWVYYPFTQLPYQTMDELEADILTVFDWDVRNTELFYLFEILTDNGGRIYYADEVSALCKTRDWDTSQMTIKEADSRKITLEMPVTWNDETFDSQLTIKRVNGYLLFGPSYFAITDEERERQANHH